MGGTGDGDAVGRGIAAVGEGAQHAAHAAAGTLQGPRHAAVAEGSGPACGRARIPCCMHRHVWPPEHGGVIHQTEIVRMGFDLHLPDNPQDPQNPGMVSA